MTAATLKRPKAAAKKPAAVATAADLLDLIARLGAIDPARVRMDPLPGTATEKDALYCNDRLKLRPAFELVERTLVEKAVAVEEPLAAFNLGFALELFVRPRKLGVILPSDAMLELAPGLIRLPDLSFISPANWREWQKTKPAVGKFGPDIAVEVLSKSNTKAEMARKRREYFAAGAKLVWEINPRQRTVAVYTSPTAATRLTADDELTGGDVLPGFRVAVSELFADPLA